MHSGPCDALRRQGYQFFSPESSAALKPCLWCKRALRGGEMCYKHQFYGIDSHRCVQMTPTLRCNQRCLFCWRSFEHEYPGERDLSPAEIVGSVRKYQKKALSGYKPSPYVTQERFSEALDPKHVAISLSGEPTLYPYLPELIDLFSSEGFTSFLVSNGTRPGVLAKCRPFQTYISLTAPDRETYMKVCRPLEDTWDAIQESLSLMGSRRSAVRITLVKGYNDHEPGSYARMIQESGTSFAEVKGYMFLGYSRNRLERGNMPSFAHVKGFAEKVAAECEYRVRDENPLSRVVLLERVE